MEGECSTFNHTVLVASGSFCTCTLSETVWSELHSAWRHCDWSIGVRDVRVSMGTWMVEQDLMVGASTQSQHPRLCVSAWFHLVAPPFLRYKWLLSLNTNADMNVNFAGSSTTGSPLSLTSLPELRLASTTTAALAGLFQPSSLSLLVPSAGEDHQQQQSFPCDKCGELFRSKVALRRHETYVCNNANAIFSTINQQFQERQQQQDSNHQTSDIKSNE